ncbi:uncharacterized protein LOC135341125 [Halichondria panicea]|uniref:uncharacterized protein LOC135341125 n=1 Tax=Halichondria panicea TaxID=6063 RepID=UPI00312B79C0
MQASGQYQWGGQGSNLTVGIPTTAMPHTIFMKSRFSPGTRSSSVIAEDTVKENMAKHQKSILDSLDPSQLYSLLDQFELDEECMDVRLTRRKKAKLLYEEVKNKSAYFDFLSNLEEDTEHMGHWYIVSLLRGVQFAADETILLDSEIILDKIQKNVKMVVKELDVTDLEPYLIEEKLVTDNEREKLRNPQNTKQDKAKMLLTILKTKGPTAHSIFVRKCLSSKVHTDLKKFLLVPRDSMKRRASTDATSFSESTSTTAVTKRYPSFLETPKGITTYSYIQTMATIREKHQTGGQASWTAAEEIIQRELMSPEISLEMKIALLLESCNPYVLSKKSEEVLLRVKRARKMCTQLYDQDSNPQVLEGRCEWVLSRLYKLLGDLHESRKHLDTAFSLIANCEPGEENMLASFMLGCILLDCENKSIGEEKRTINSFKFVLSLATEQDYGTKIIQFCQIRLAQAYVGSSVRSPGKSTEEVSQVNREDAKILLREIDQQHMRPRTRCLYFMTCSDVYRTDDKIEKASAYAEQAMEIAQEHNLTHEVGFIKLRQLS